MLNFIKQGIQRIKETKKYAREKNVPNWTTNLIGSIMMVFLGSTIFTLYAILFIGSSSLSHFAYTIIGSTIIYYPFILTFLIMIKYGHYPIKMLILFTYYIQKGLMKLIDKLDMYLWKKTGKDSLASSFMMKHRKLIQFLFWLPLIITFIINHIPRS